MTRSQTLHGELDEVNTYSIDNDRIAHNRSNEKGEDTASEVLVDFP